MSDGEVKIHVSADRDLKQIEEAQKRIKDLHRAADAYESNNKVDMSSAAKSARSEARGLERDVARWTKERAAGEKAVTREMAEQTAQRKAGIGLTPTRVSQAVGIGQQLMAGGDPASSASSMLVSTAARSGNPAVIALAVAGAIATSLASVFAKQRDEDTMRGLQQDTRIAKQNRRLNRESGVFGSSGTLVSTAREAQEEVASRRDARPELEEKARVKWNAPSTWSSLIGIKNEGEKELEVNDQQAIEAQVRAASAKKRAEARYRQTEGGLELDILRGRSKRSLSGQREAFVAEESGKAFAKYTEAKRQGADEDMAKEMATLTYQNDLRERQAQAGAGMVSAKSGGAEIAAAARWSMAGTPQGGDIGSKLDSLIGVVNRGNQEAGMEKLHK
jgi:hypothetical protein